MHGCFCLVHGSEEKLQNNSSKDRENLRAYAGVLFFERFLKQIAFFSKREYNQNELLCKPDIIKINAKDAGRGAIMRSPKAKQWKYILMLFLCCCMVFPLYVSAKATQSRTVKVAFPVQDGMSYFHPDGTPDGYNYVYLEKIAEYTGWKMEYIPYDSGDKNADIQNALNDLESGKVDLLGSILKNQYTE